MGGTAKRTAVLAIATMVGFAAPISLYAAGSHYFEPVAAADAMPPYEILTRVRTLALDPIGEPVRRGPYYILHAYDRAGTEVRVVVDAQFGDVLSVTPANLVTPGAGAGTVGGARIIHIPAVGEEATANAAPADAPEVGQAAPDEPAPPRPATKPRRAAKQVAKREREVRRRPFSSAPPPPVERRAVLSAPPSAADDDPSPIYPTPRFSGPDQAATVAIPSPTAPAASPDPPPPQN
jgi:hypothetical protein